MNFLAFEKSNLPSCVCAKGVHSYSYKDESSATKRLAGAVHIIIYTKIATTGRTVPPGFSPTPPLLNVT